jgi:hypothetical protein
MRPWKHSCALPKADTLVRYQINPTKPSRGNEIHSSTGDQTLHRALPCTMKWRLESQIGVPVAPSSFPRVTGFARSPGERRGPRLTGLCRFRRTFTASQAKRSRSSTVETISCQTPLVCGTPLLTSHNEHFGLRSFKHITRAVQEE